MIHNAVSSQPWSGEANVHVSIVNWVKAPELTEPFILDGKRVEGITTTLEAGEDLPETSRLAGNRGFQHAGVVPNPTDEFCITDVEADELLARDDSDYREVVQRYLQGEDLLQTVTQEPTRWIINFRDWPLERAMDYPAALDLVRDRVKPVREGKGNDKLAQRWWQFSRTLASMWDAVDPLPRFIVAPATGKRILMCWARPGWCPSNLVNVFPFDDDYAMGVLSSTWHLRWAAQTKESSTLETRQRYVSRSFHTFAWPPAPTDAVVDAVRTASRSLIELRSQLCASQGVGLTKLYNQVDEGAHVDLKTAHTDLDAAVATAYGWEQVSGWPDVRRRVHDLNRAVANEDQPYSPFDVASSAVSPSLF